MRRGRAWGAGRHGTDRGGGPVACVGQGIRPRIALEAGAADAIADLGARSPGVAVLSRPMAVHYRDRLTAIPLGEVGTPALLALVRRAAGWSATCSARLRDPLMQGGRTR